MMPYVLAVDPGKTTGSAFWSTESGLEDVRELGFEEFLAYADRLLLLHGPNLIVVSEAYIVGPETLKMGAEGDPGDPYRRFSLEIIGALRFLCTKHGSEFAPLQTAAAAKSVITNARLKKLDWYARGKEHGRDATRHLALFLMARRVLSAEALGV